jgi:hypothetical protein
MPHALPVVHRQARPLRLHAPLHRHAHDLHSPVRWRLTNVVLPVPPSPTRTSLNAARRHRGTAFRHACARVQERGAARRRQNLKTSKPKRRWWWGLLTWDACGGYLACVCTSATHASIDERQRAAGCERIVQMRPPCRLHAPPPCRQARRGSRHRPNAQALHPLSAHRAKPLFPSLSRSLAFPSSL